MSPLKPDLVPLIVCPACHSDLKVEVTRRERVEIEEGSLNCTKCGALYPIRCGIPRFVTSDLYVRSFSAEWNIFSRTQLDHGRFGYTRETFIKLVGMKPEMVHGIILEAGCGMGRFLDVVSRSPRATIVGFDLSLAVEAAYKNVGGRPNVHIVQADIVQPPFRVEGFDLVYSLGVLHHTNNPKEAFLKLVPLLKRRGEIAIWVYHKYRRPPLSDFYRIFTSRMPWSMVLGICRFLSKLHRLQERCRYLLVLIPTSTLSDSERRILDTFDWYSPKYQFKFTNGEVIVWFKEAGLHQIQILSNPVSIKGKK